MPWLEAIIQSNDLANEEGATVTIRDWRKPEIWWQQNADNISMKRPILANLQNLRIPPLYNVLTGLLNTNAYDGYWQQDGPMVPSGIMLSFQLRP